MNVQRSTTFEKNADFALELPYSGYVTTDKSWRQSPLPTDISRLYLVEAGNGVIYSGGERMVLEPGYAYLAPKGLPCGYCGNDSVTKLFFHVKLTQKHRDLFEGARHFASFRIPIERIQEMTALYFSEDKADQTRLRAAILEILFRFLQDERCRREELPDLSPLTERALAYIGNRLCANLCVREVAEHCYVSAALLRRRFREEMGMSPAAYIERCVMQEARRRLTEGEESLGVISERLGFCDQFYFSRRFRAFFGVSPREYRNGHFYT